MTFDDGHANEVPPVLVSGTAANAYSLFHGDVCELCCAVAGSVVGA